MTIQVRKSQDRGFFDFGWLKTHHTFSFGDYVDPTHHHFRDLRVINEDFVAPSQGFPTHAHRDMEILTYLLSGSLEHRDSLGNGSLIRTGDVQRMSAGSGVTHSEFNPSEKETVHLLQIWIFPEKKGISPGYEQKTVREEEKKNRFCLIASPEGGPCAVNLYQQTRIYAAKLDLGKSLSYGLSKKRYAWIQVAEGSLKLNGVLLGAGDGASAESQVLEFEAVRPCHFLLFDLG